ncbi:MAG: hypothetical protein KTR32_08655 [Granulosicoccus sp.]|nr:hypothetical protein [Granulosicoccus sp.]
MAKLYSAERYESLLSIDPGHRLVPGSKRRVKNDSTVYETFWLEEHNEQNERIARYRTWNNRSLVPPYAQQTGWERYSNSGQLLDREVRYSQRDNMDYIH